MKIVLTREDESLLILKYSINSIIDGITDGNRLRKHSLRKFETKKVERDAAEGNTHLTGHEIEHIINGEPKENRISKMKYILCCSCDIYFYIDDAKQHIQSSKCKFWCKICKRQLETLYNYAVHCDKHEFEQQTNESLQREKNVQKTTTTSLSDEDNDFTCDLCYDVLKSELEFQEHMELHKEIGTLSDKANQVQKKSTKKLTSTKNKCSKIA